MSIGYAAATARMETERENKSYIANNIKDAAKNGSYILVLFVNEGLVLGMPAMALAVELESDGFCVEIVSNRFQITW